VKPYYAGLAAIGLLASPAFAAEDGFYAEAGIGYFQLDIGGGWDAGDTAFKIGGGYNFLKYFGAEVEWIDFGSPEKYGLSVDITGWNFSGIGRWPVTDQFNLFAKLGVIMWDGDSSYRFDGTNLRGSGDGTDFSWGLGAGWNFTDHFTLNAEYQGFDFEDTNGSDLWIASAVWRF
jgi:OmpA-OmpF porin, OOP family